MADQTKIVKGGFRATLALIISIIALILSFVAYSSPARDEGLNPQIKSLQAGYGKNEGRQRRSAGKTAK